MYLTRNQAYRKVSGFESPSRQMLENTALPGPFSSTHNLTRNAPTLSSHAPNWLGSKKSTALAAHWRRSSRKLASKRRESFAFLKIGEPVLDKYSHRGLPRHRFAAPHFVKWRVCHVCEVSRHPYWLFELRASRTLLVNLVPFRGAHVDASGAVALELNAMSPSSAG